MSNKPIGVFDSGIGGLTVAKQIVSLLPNESIIYLGDTARVPYGTRGKEVITKFALELAKFLLKQEVKFLVVACNTISATCLDKIQEVSSVPVLGVIKPSVIKIIQTTQTKTVGIIGTRATINSKAYDLEIQSLDPQIRVTAKACPLFVPIAEEGLGDNEVAKIAAKEYLSDYTDTKIDTLHLGCTHYPLLRGVIQDVVGKNITIIDSARPTAEELKKILDEKEMLNMGNTQNNKFYFTDAPDRVVEAAGLFFGQSLVDNIEKIDVTDLSNS